MSKLLLGSWEHAVAWFQRSIEANPACTAMSDDRTALAQLEPVLEGAQGRSP
jgi:hypothetical protein